MGGILNSITWWLMAKALAVFMVAVMSTVLVVGIVTSDQGSIALSWSLYDLPESEKVLQDDSE
jgi:hypothetical protein